MTEHTSSQGGALTDAFADFRRPPVSNFLRSTCSSRIAGLELVRDLASKLDVHCTDMYSAALGFLLVRYTGREQFSIGIVPYGLREVHLLDADLRHNPMFEEALKCHRFTTGARCETPRSGDCVDASANIGVLLLPFNHDHGETSPVDYLSREARSIALASDLVLSVKWNDDEFRIDCEYDDDVFSFQTITSLLERLALVLRICVRNPETRLWDMMILSREDEKRLLVDWNRNKRTYPDGESIQSLFEIQVERSRDRPALFFNDEIVTFGDLDSQAAAIALYLRKTGTMPGAVVGVLMDRSAYAVIAIFGILRAGCTYVPLDAAYPAHRLQLILRDSKTQRVLTNTRSSRLAKSLEIESLDIESNWSSIENLISAAFTPREKSAETFCIIYTSGSTGTPKGVPCELRPTLNCFYWMWEDYPFSSGEVGCLTTSLSFGDSIQELFGPLLHGVPVVIVSQDTVKDPARLVGLLKRCCVTRIVLVPSLLRVIVERFANLGEELPDLKLWISSGEALPRHVANQFFESAPEMCLVNMYGTSELSNDVTAQILTPDDLRGRAVPIGRPISNTTTFILDAHLNPVPEGVVGELYVGGEGLVSSYLNDQSLTSQRFVAASRMRSRSRYSGGDRLYRTGDYVRYNAVRSSLEYIGRVDNQVNVRGYRVELGEIEAAVERHASVRQAIVVQREHPSGDERLIAYVILHEGKQFNPSEVLNESRKLLPSHMLPLHLTEIDVAPLTPSGKICTRDLPAPCNYISGQVDRQVEPRDEIEQQLRDIWCNVLWLTSVGVTEDFFSVGGHSLAAMDVALRVEKVMGVEIEASELHRSCTIELMAAVIRRKLRAHTASVLE